MSEAVSTGISQGNNLTLERRVAENKYRRLREAILKSMNK
jgi:hypothetical protein